MESNKTYYFEEVLESCKEDDDKFQWKHFFRQFMVFSCLWSGYFLGGLIQGSPTVIVPQLRREAHSLGAVSDDVASWMSSVVYYAAVPLSFIVPLLSKRIGRKYIMFSAYCTTFIAFIVYYISKSTTQLLISFAMSGLLQTCNVAMSLIVLTEYISPKYRGVVLTMKSAMFGWGIWTANAIGTFAHWRNIPPVGLTLAGITTIVTLFWPESPYWLAAKNKFHKCSKNHRFLRGTNKASEKELEELIKSQKEYQKESLKNNKNQNCFKRMLKIFGQKEFYKPFLLCLVVGGIYITSAKLICAFYAIDVIKKITNNESTAYTGMLILDGISVFGMYLGSITNKFFRRRTLFFIYTSCGIISLFVLSFYMFLVQWYVIKENAYMSIFLLMVYSLSMSSGPFVMCTSIVGELTPLRNRNLFAVCLALKTNLLTGTSIKLGLFIFKSLHMSGSFLFFAISCSIFLCIAYKYLPETKDKTLMEIQHELCGI